ncbi:alpha/beta hydrolase-fold protein [Tenacibaculum aiptasiae]|uniref:alpha/beta hydrolase-fold protein n=1 Tax=Tenacibaculum aiptasiae TaxID=426481 RepID=UPI00232C33F9|nr:alpha/beta hydrolase-fold protein [Tenacibaculum aiptasiae]
MKLKIVLCFLLFQTVFYSLTAQEATPNVVGNKQVISSKVLNQDREISIYLPADYKKTAYPVLYIVDGQRYFLNGVLYQNTLQWQDKTPPFIVVGIHTQQRKRRKLLYPDAQKFILFLTDELIPFVEKNYNTAPKRFYFGWEMAGGLALELLAQPENIFTAYFIASPTHFTENRLSSLRKKLVTQGNTTEYIYVSLSPSEHWATESVNQFKNLLSSTVLPKTTWKFDSLPNENHHSTPTLTLHKGLNLYFSDYPYLRFNSLNDFNQYGGLAQLKAHYTKRGDKYNTSKEIHKSTKHFLLLQAMKENNYPAFALFMKEFDNYYQTKTRDLWFNRYAQFYLQHQKANKAIEVLSVGLRKFKKSAILLRSLGDAHLQQGNKAKAKVFYTRAFETAIQNEDRNIEAYRLKLEGI